MTSKGLSSNTMNLKFMQRAQPTPATGSKTQTSPASLPKASTSQTGTDAFPFTPSSTAKSMKNQRKVIIEAGYAAFPLLLTASGRSRQQQQQTDNSGRQSFGHQEAAPSPQVKRAKSPSTASKIKMSDSEDESMPSSSEDEKPSAKPKHATKRQPSQVSSSKAGFQKPGGFADVKPKQKPRDGKVTREEQEDGFVDEMIQGARAKRIKRESVSPKKPKNVKREPSSYKK